MGNTRRNYSRVIFLYGIFFTAWIFWAVCGGRTAHAVSRFFRLSLGAEDGGEATTIQYRYPKEFQKTLQKYRIFAMLYREEASRAIPGLAFTDLGESVCSQMVPQGICIAGDYMLISAYDNGANVSFRKNTGYVPQNSVIYVLSYREGCPGEFLTTLVLPDVNHVGGLAFDGRRIWIAKSSTKTLSAISYEVVKEAAGCGQESVLLPRYEATVSCGVRASFVSFYDQRLWVGTYNSLLQGKSSLTAFSIIEGQEPKLVMEAAWKIPSCAQGITFLERGERVYMAVSASCGRFLTSTLYLYEMEGADQTEPTLAGSISLPPMSEELISDGSHVYVLFESGATCFSTGAYRKCPYPVDRICALDSSGMLAAVGE